jgi:hypothetical protein
MDPLSLIHVDEGKTCHVVIWDHFRTYIKWRNFTLEELHESLCVITCLEKCILYNSFATYLILPVHMKISLIIIFMIFIQSTFIYTTRISAEFYVHSLFNELFWGNTLKNPTVKVEVMKTILPACLLTPLFQWEEYAYYLSTRGQKKSNSCEGDTHIFTRYMPNRGSLGVHKTFIKCASENSILNVKLIKI